MKKIYLVLTGVLLSSGAFAGNPVKEFADSLLWSEAVLEKRNLPYYTSPVWQHLGNAIPKLNSMPEGNAMRELEAFEKSLLLVSMRHFGQPYTPNIGWNWKARKEGYLAEIDRVFTDWKNFSATLAKYGLKVNTDFERGRIQKFREKLKRIHVLPSDPEFDQAFIFYQVVVEEKFRICAQVLLFEQELAALERTAEFRNANGGSFQLNGTEALKKTLREWRESCSRGDYLHCLKKLEPRAKMQIAGLKKQMFGKSPDIRPGTSFLSVGQFGFGGSWQPLLNFNAKDSGFYLDHKNEFKPYVDSSVDWEVCFTPEGMNLKHSESITGSWTFAQREAVYNRYGTKEECRVDVFWSSLAPGVLYDAHCPSMTVSELSGGIPAAPDAVAGVFNGKTRVFKRGEAVPVDTLSENWLLLLWRENPAPKLPVLLYFEHKPQGISWDSGFAFRRTPEVGKFAAGTLYGAVPQKPSYGEQWKELPQKELEQCRRLARHLAWFPLDMDEFFSFEKFGKVRIWNRISKAVKLSADAAPYIPFPPIYTMTDTIRPDQTLSEPLLKTRYGFYRTAGGDALSYELPVPELQMRIALKPLKGDEKYIRQLNECYRTLMKEPWKTVYTRQINRARTAECLPAWCLLEPSSRAILTEPRTPSLTELALSGEMSCAGRDRNLRGIHAEFMIDPLTGRSAFLGGWRGKNQGNEEDIRGDMTALNMNYLNAAYSLAVMDHDWGTVELHRERILQHYSSADFNQCWHVPGVNALASGIIVYGDMYGDGYHMFPLMYRLALGLKDRELADRTRYLAAKQNAVTMNLVSPNVVVYNAHLKNITEPGNMEYSKEISGGPASPGAAIGQLGVNYAGFVTRPWRPYGKMSWNAPMQTNGCNFLDYFNLSLTRFARRDANLWLETFMKAIPEWGEPDYLYLPWRGERAANAWNLLKYLALASHDAETVRMLYDKVFPMDYSRKVPLRGLSVPKEKWENYYQKLFLEREWVFRSSLIPKIVAQNDPLWVADFGRARLMSGTYDREKRIARIGVAADDRDRLIFVSLVKPLSVLCNGKNVSFRHAEWEYDYEVALEPGVSNIEIRLPEFAIDDLVIPEESVETAALSLEKAPVPEKRQKLEKPRFFKVGLCRSLDLKPFCNNGFSDSPSRMVVKEFWKFPKKDVVGGVPLQFVAPEENGGKSAVFLRGTHRKEFPSEIRGIPVNRVVKRIFFYHGMCYNTENGKVLTYRLNFADGQVREIPVYAGSEIADWKIVPGAKTFNEPLRAIAGKAYPPMAKEQWGEGAGGFLFVWENDVRRKGVTNQDVDQLGLAELRSIDIISAGRATPIVFAITVEE